MYFIGDTLLRDTREQNEAKATGLHKYILAIHKSESNADSKLSGLTICFWRNYIQRFELTWGRSLKSFTVVNVSVFVHCDQTNVYASARIST